MGRGVGTENIDHEEYQRVHPADARPYGRGRDGSAFCAAPQGRCARTSTASSFDEIKTVALPQTDPYLYNEVLGLIAVIADGHRRATLHRLVTVILLLRIFRLFENMRLAGPSHPEILGSDGYAQL